MNELVILLREADRLFGAGMFREAIVKNTSALQVFLAFGKEDKAVIMYANIITCHAKLWEVSLRSAREELSKKVVP